MKSSFQKLQNITAVLDRSGNEQMSLRLWTAAGAAPTKEAEPDAVAALDDGTDNSFGGGYFPVPTCLRNLGQFSDALKPNRWLEHRAFAGAANGNWWMITVKVDAAVSLMRRDLESLLGAPYHLDRLQSNKPGTLSFYFTPTDQSTPKNAPPATPTVQSSVVTAAKLGPASDPWVHALALLQDKQNDAALVRLRGIATMPASSQNFASFQRVVPEIADQNLQKLLGRFCDRVKSGRFDEEFRRRYSKDADQQSLMRDLFRYFRVAYDYVPGGMEAGVAEVEPSRETVALAQRALKTISAGKPMSHANAQQVLRQLEELQQQFKQDFNGAWFARQ